MRTMHGRRPPRSRGRATDVVVLPSSQTFLEGLSRLPVPTTAQDAVVSIPQALYAICLNLEGLKLARQANPLASLIRVLTSARHLKSLQVRAESSDAARWLGRSQPGAPSHVSRGKDSKLCLVQNGFASPS